MANSARPSKPANQRQSAKGKGKGKEEEEDTGSATTGSTTTRPIKDIPFTKEDLNPTLLLLIREQEKKIAGAPETNMDPEQQSQGDELNLPAGHPLLLTSPEFDGAAEDALNRSAIKNPLTIENLIKEEKELQYRKSQKLAMKAGFTAPKPTPYS